MHLINSLVYIEPYAYYQSDFLYCDCASPQQNYYHPILPQIPRFFSDISLWLVL